MNYNNYILLDFESISKNPFTTQVTQLAASIIHGRKLEFIENATFKSYINIIEDEDLQKKYGLGSVEQEALDITGITLEQIRAAPSLKTVWASFSDWIKQYNPSGKEWTSCILCGHNILGFDQIIIDRIAGGHTRLTPAESEPYGFGPWNKEYNRCTLFHPIIKMDTLHISHLWFENNADLHKLSFDALRKYMGMKTLGAHNAEVDVRQSGELLIKYLKLHRFTSKKVKFENSFAEEDNK